MVDQPLGDQVHHLAFAAEHAEHPQQARAEQFAALAFGQLGMDDDVGKTGLVFQRQEDHAVRRARPLAASDDAGGARRALVFQFAQAAGRGVAPALEMAAQQRERMAAQREAQVRVVGDEVCAFGGPRQRRRFLDGRRVEQQVALHRLLLEDRHAQRAFEHAAHRRGRIGDRLLALPPPQIGMDHVALDRPRPHDGDLDHQVVEAARPQARQHRHLRPRLDLEDADAVDAAEHGIHRLVFGRDVGHGERPAALARHAVERTADRCEHAQRQHIDLHQSERVDVVLVPLDHAASRHARVLDRHQAVEPAARDDETADVLRQVAGKALQRPRPRQCQRHPFSYARTRRIEAGLIEALRPLVRLVPPGEIGGQRVDAVVVDAQRAPAVAQRRAAAVADDHGGERGAGAAVFAVEVPRVSNMSMSN